MLPLLLERKLTLIFRYINHADGPCILSLIKTALPWQAQGYRELLSYYIIIPEPRIGVHESVGGALSQ